LIVVVSIIPVGLGLVVGVPVMMRGLYISYLDVFKIRESAN